jgi:hypothetical protein
VTRDPDGERRAQQRTILSLSFETILKPPPFRNRDHLTLEADERGLARAGPCAPLAEDPSPLPSCPIGTELVSLSMTHATHTSSEDDTVLSNSQTNI